MVSNTQSMEEFLVLHKGPLVVDNPSSSGKIKDD